MKRVFPGVGKCIDWGILAKCKYRVSQSGNRKSYIETMGLIGITSGVGGLQGTSVRQSNVGSISVESASIRNFHTRL